MVVSDTIEPTVGWRVSVVNSWWRHQMETFSALLAICAGNSPVPGEFPAKKPVTRSFDVFFDVHPNKWFNKQSWAGDLRRYRAHYDVIVMDTYQASMCKHVRGFVVLCYIVVIISSLKSIEAMHWPIFFRVASVSASLDQSQGFAV